MKGPLFAAFVLAAACPGCSDEIVEAPAESDSPETRIIRYLEAEVQPGEAIVVSELYSEVFTSPEEQAALDRLFNTFLKMPLFLVQFQSGTGRTPTLGEISEQFGFTIPGQAEVMLRIMESDPRIPRFIERDPLTGEITRLDVDPILAHPQFGQEIERSLAGWEGRRMPPFELSTFDGREISSDSFSGQPYMVYVWFSNCPPCLATSPLLVELYDTYLDRGFEIVAANADRVLDLPYDDRVRSDYVNESGIRFVTAHLTEDVQESFGGVAIFPTMFFVDRQGIVVRHFMNFQEKAVLVEAIEATL
jgi:thiol-disulfide isomerase/thioredoxin